MSSPTSSTPWWRTRRGFVTLAAAAAVIVIVAVFLIVTLASRSSSTIAVTPQPSATDDAWAKSVCGLDGFEDSGELTAAPAATWQKVGELDSPYSDTAGPGIVTPDGYRSCFAHTVDGAVLAAVSAFNPATSQEGMVDFLTNSVVPGEGRDAKLTIAKLWGEDQPYENVVFGEAARFPLAGVHLASYDGHAATVYVYSRDDTGDGHGATVNLEWLDGDWKLVLDEFGGTGTGAGNHPSFEGLDYVPWSAP